MESLDRHSSPHFGRAAVSPSATGVDFLNEAGNCAPTRYRHIAIPGTEGFWQWVISRHDTRFPRTANPRRAIFLPSVKFPDCQIATLQRSRRDGVWRAEFFTRCGGRRFLHVFRGARFEEGGAHFGANGMSLFLAFSTATIAIAGRKSKIKSAHV